MALRLWMRVCWGIEKIYTINASNSIGSVTSEPARSIIINFTYLDMPFPK